MVEPSLEELRANVLEAANAVVYVAKRELARIDEEQALSDELWQRRWNANIAIFAVREFGCWLFGHDWRERFKPIAMRRWCGRCFEIEDC